MKKNKKIKSFGRGYKLCENCHSNQGVRTRVCKICSHEFPAPQQRLNFKKRKLKIEECDWKTLKKGDKIRVFKHGGTSFICDDMVYNIERNGIYFVHHLTKDGIIANDKKSGGRNFIYMGQKKENKFGFINSPHKIKKIID